MKALDIYKKCMPGCINAIGNTVADILNCIEKTYGPIDESTKFELKVILNEIMLNAIKHGNRGDESKHVSVHAGVSSTGYLLLIVEDEGRGYDYHGLCKNHKPDCNKADISSFEEGGRGIMIVNSLCDKVKVNARGNRIMVLKKLNNK